MPPDDRPPDDKGFTVRDRRWWLDPEVDLDALAEAGEGPRKPTALEELEARLAERDHQLQETLQAHRAASAEMDQVRQRLQRDVERRVELERARLAEPFVDVLEGLGRLEQAARAAGGAAEAIGEGAGLLARQLHDRLQGLGLRPIQAAGQAFDPRCMEALSAVQVEPARVGQVLEQLRPGYTLGEAVLRPAGVVVGTEREG